MMTPIVDAHLDIALNAMSGRDLTLPVDEIRRREPKRPDPAMTSLSDFALAGVALIGATLFVEPANSWLKDDLHGTLKPRVYYTPQEAQAQALEQLEMYERWQDQGLLRIITSQATLRDHLLQWQSDRKLGVIVLMESADPIVRVDDLPDWFARGVRMIGLSWGKTRYAGGTGSPGPLSVEGRELVQAMRELKLIHDTSHLDEEAFWEAFELGNHAVCASHSNARALLMPPPEVQPEIPQNRHLSDAMIQAIGRKDGMVGLNLLNAFLEPRWRIGGNGIEVRVDRQVRAQAEHIAALIGWERIGIGSDVDAGFGAEEAPNGFQHAREYPNLAQIAPINFKDAVLGGNWLRFFDRHLP